MSIHRTTFITQRTYAITDIAIPTRRARNCLNYLVNDLGWIAMLGSRPTVSVLRTAFGWDWTYTVPTRA